MTELLSNTAVRVALGAVATTAVAAGSYILGTHHGAQKVIAELPTILADLLDQKEDNETK